MLVIILILINIIDITVEVAALFTGLLVDEGIVTPEGKYLITWFNISLQYQEWLNMVVYCLNI